MDTDAQTGKVSLQDYFDSIAGHDVSTADFLKNALCYDETRTYLENNPDVVTRLYRAAPEGRTQIIGEIVAAVRSGSPPRGAEGLEQFKPSKEQLAESRPRAFSPKEVADIVELAGLTDLERRQKEVENLKIPERVAAFVKNLRQQQRDELLKSLNDPITTENPAKAKDEYLERIDRSNAQDKHELKAVVQEIFEHTHLASDAAAEVKKTNNIVRVVVRHIDAPKVFTENFLKKISVTENITPTTIGGAERFARIATVVNTPKIEGFSLSPFFPGAKVTPTLEKAMENLSFLQTWDAAGGIDGITKAFGANVVSSEGFQKLIQSGNALAAEIRGSGAGLSALGAPGLKIFHEAENLVKEVFTAPPSQDALYYLESLHATGTTVVEVRQFFTARLFAEHPTMFHFSLNTSPLEWILRFGKKEAAAGASEAVAATGLKAGGSAAAKEAVSAFLTKTFAFLGADTIEALSGPIGWAVFALANVLPWIWRGVKSAFAPIGALFSVGASGVAGALQGSFNLPAAPQGWADKNAIWIILICALGLPILTTASMMTNTMASFPTSGTGEFTGEEGSVGPIQYTGPQPSGPFQCLNFNVSPATFNEVRAVPLTSGQGGTLNNALNTYPQLGLYNCLLDCPQHKTDIYSGGASNWWGWTVNAHTVVLYNGFFASGSVHLQARLIAHEFAHILAANDSGVFSAFMHGTTGSPAGYCGCLGTYPSGTPKKPCSPLETPSETFAEAAAMFLTGENLQSLCPAAYNFMSVLFNQCAK